MLPQLPTQQPAASNGPRERHHSLAAAAPQWSYHVPWYTGTLKLWPPRREYLIHSPDKRRTCNSMGPSTQLSVNLVDSTWVINSPTLQSFWKKKVVENNKC